MLTVTLTWPSLADCLPSHMSAAVNSEYAVEDSRLGAVQVWGCNSLTSRRHTCLLGNCCWLTVCIVVAVLCVLLSYVYLLYCVGIAFFYFRCRTAGYKSVFGRSCDQPP